MTDDGRRAGLLAAQLRALALPHLGGLEPEARSFPGGAALVAGDAAWLLLDVAPVSALGAALVWADRQRATEVHVVAGAEHAPVLARRASCFAPAPTVWAIAGPALEPAVAAPVPVPPLAPAAPELAELLVDADLEVFVEQGIVRGEVLGLEVARIVHGTTTDGTPIDHPVLEVGVGHADREMTAMVHVGLTPVGQLERVIEIVRTHRSPDAARHPLNLLAPERWLRSRLTSHPERIGLVSLRPVEGAIPRPNLRDRAVAHALGVGADGGSVVVACSTGIDLDLIPSAADARLVHAPEAELLVVVPERDAHPVTTALAARLVRPARVVTVPEDWRR